MKVCFFSPTAYSYFNPDSNTWAGGAETQQVLIARHMRDRGIEVSFIVGDYGQPEIELVEGIALIKSFEPFAGNRKLRFVPDMLRIRRAMRIAAADVYNQRSTAFFTGQLAHFARSMGAVFTFSIGSDYNCYPDCRGRLPSPMTHLYRWGLRRADAVIAQTETQRRLMREHFGLETVLIRNGIVIPEEDAATPRAAEAEPRAGSLPAESPRRPDILWVGSFRRLKRPELYLELARRNPDVRFTMIGGRGDDEAYFERVAHEARDIPNLAYIGFVPPEGIDVYYRRAYAYVNTSDLEGFPNTYLHSWAAGVPVVTIEIDPDAIIATHGTGLVAGSFEGLVGAIQALIRSPALREDMSLRARRYVREHHDIRDRGDDYIGLFEDLLASRSRKASSRSG